MVEDIGHVLTCLLGTVTKEGLLPKIGEEERSRGGRKERREGREEGGREEERREEERREEERREGGREEGGREEWESTGGRKRGERKTALFPGQVGEEK